MEQYYSSYSQLVQTDNVRNIEKKYISQNNINSFDLMEKAGDAFAKIISENFKKGKILFLCGKGGNGGDGLIAANILKKKSWKVSIVLTNINKDLSEDTRKALKKLKLVPKIFDKLKLKNFDIIVDAIYGIGITRNIGEKEKTLIKKINSSNVPIVAMDIPSGINANTGKIMGVAAECLLTVTFSRAKIGNILLPGYKNNGRLKVVDIGIPNSYFNEIKPQLIINSNKVWRDKIIFPKIDDHKYSRGYTLVIGAPKSMTGATRLAAKAAQRVGSGIVVVAANKKSENIYYSTLTSQIIKTYNNLAEFRKILDDPRINSIIVGPGLGIGPQTINKMKIIFKNKKRKILVDADAISSFHNKIDLLQDITKNSDTVFTPHYGEFMKIFPNIKGNSIEKALNASNKLQSTFILKGPNTIISSKKKNKVIVNKPGAKWLATAGSGDVLSGVIGGLMSTGMDSFSAAGLGVYIHTKAGQEAGAGLIAEDLIETIPLILKKDF